MKPGDALREARRGVQERYRRERLMAEDDARRRLLSAFYLPEPYPLPLYNWISPGEAAARADTAERVLFQIKFFHPRPPRPLRAGRSKRWGSFAGHGWEYLHWRDVEDAEAIVREAGERAVLDAMTAEGWVPPVLRGKQKKPELARPLAEVRERAAAAYREMRRGRS